MLCFLRVRNFALIDELEIHFKPGLSLLSGETGAGKSIIVDALGLLTGAKASTEMVRSGELRAVVEAIFQADVRADLERLGLDGESDEIVVRREISADERNRVYINNQPSTVTALRQLSPALLDIHGQHEQQTLLDSASQLSLIDAFAETEATAEQVRGLHAEMEQLQREVAELIVEHQRRTERLDLLVFQRDEIQKANPQPQETEQARARLNVLSHSGKLQEAAALGYQNLYESETSALSILAQTQRPLRDVSQHDDRLQPILEQVEAARIAIQDIAYALRDYADQVDADPRELERLQARLAELERLHRKYGPDLLDHLDKVRREIDSIGLTETKKDELERKLAGLRTDYGAVSSELSRRRRNSTKKLEAAIERELKSLAMPHAKFRIAWEDTPARASGFDRVEFEVSANPGQDPLPLKTVASGGELSRIMLALRTILAADRGHNTLIFDEVDAGIGGKAAETVGRKLKELSARYQILCVTHLAQIAAFADHQYRIEKVVKAGQTVTRVEFMSGEARIDELARMMSGSRITDAARQHVKELLGLV